MQKIIGKVLFVGKPGYILSFVTISLMCYMSYVAGKIVRVTNEQVS